MSSLPALKSTSSTAAALRPHRGPSQVSLIDLLDRLLQGGIAIEGDIVLAVANIDLVEVDLRLLISAVDKAAGR